jgi:hypothetical protein
MGIPLDHLFAKTHRNQGGAARRRPPYFGGKKKLGLLGSTSSLVDAPFFDQTWTLAAHPCCRPECEREPDWYFDMHRPECFRVEKKQWNPKYYSWLKALQTPIFMQENWPDIPMAVRYPKEEVFAEYRQYFSNHCAYMIALAMKEGVTHIGLFGCQYSGAERAVQRDSLTYWLGRFEQAGGTLVIPERHNTLLSMPLYGYDSHDEKGKLLKCYRPEITVQKKAGEPAIALVQPSEAAVMPRPAGEPERTFEMAFA